MKTWNEMKAAVDLQMNTDPQRGTLNRRAIASVEEGLQHLTGAGYQFEIAPKGTLAELYQVHPKPAPTSTLSIAQAVTKVGGDEKPTVPSQFEAKAS